MREQPTIDMESVWEQLGAIEKVEPKGDLYAKTLQKIQEKQVISMAWVRAVACILAIGISTEVYYVYNSKVESPKNLSEMIYVPNNNLYND